MNLDADLNPFRTLDEICTREVRSRVACGQFYIVSKQRWDSRSTTLGFDTRADGDGFVV
jgi:hypothetical protein